MKQNRSLVLSFLDEGGKSKSITIREPIESVSPDDIKNVANIITQNKLVLGKIGFLKTLQGAYFVTRTIRTVE